MKLSMEFRRQIDPKSKDLDYEFVIEVAGEFGTFKMTRDELPASFEASCSYFQGLVTGKIVKFASEAAIESDRGLFTKIDIPDTKHWLNDFDQVLGIIMQTWRELDWLARKVA